MNYDKGPQLTVGMLKNYLAHIPEDIKIRVGIGDLYAPAHYLTKKGNELCLCPDCYMQDAYVVNTTTVISFMKRDK